MTYGKGQELWKKAQTIIPGGNQLLSKRSERFLPGLWPAYYSKAKGCEVWDLEGKHFYDFAGMGVGSCTIGYADEDINNEVIKAINDGSMCSLNSFEEIDLAEKLIDLHPWADMARFARTGGEACSIAIRIGRGATDRSKIGFCGYHGWHDWYISANLGDNTKLDEQLLPGLKPEGVPRELQGTMLPFNFNKLTELEDIAAQHKNELGVIIMEPERGTPAEDGFLEGVREIATRIGAVLIFDEITSGFRANIGGIHLTYGIEPDIVIFGKALGNGFPISAIVGRREVMDSAQNSFISSTFWTERIGFVAALAAIKKMEDKNVPKHLRYYGERINEGWKMLSQKHGIDLKISGISALTHLTFQTEKSLEVQTLYAQSLYEKGILLGSSVYSTYAYSNEIVDKFIGASDTAFAQIKEALNSGNVQSYLKDDVLDTNFKRLTEPE